MDDLAARFRFYADNSAGAYAPKYRAITGAIADDPELIAVVAAAPDDARHPGVLLGAVRYLLADRPDQSDHPLAVLYRSANPADDKLIGAFRSFVLDHRAALAEVMAHRRVQTNEIARSATLAPAIQEVQRRHELPIALVDVGASAGLNLLVDRVHIDYRHPDGRHSTIGPADSSVQLACDALADGPPASAPPLEVAWRLGLDRNPIDLGDPDEARWLEACIWPDHPERVERLHRAIALHERHPAPIATGDAIADLPRLVAEAPADAHLTVTTSWVVFYFGPDQRLAFEDVLANTGRRLSWVSAEHPSVVRNLAGVRPSRSDEVDLAQVGLVEFAGDGSPGTREFLAWSHNHGAWLDWT